MWNIAFMAWRIGDILELDDQIDWLSKSGFDSIGFHASPGISGVWQGIDPAQANFAKRQLLRQKLSAFKSIEIHAPFELTLKTSNLGIIIERLDTIIEFAGDVGASILTIHAELPSSSTNDFEKWQPYLDRLDTLAKKAGVIIGLELMQDFEYLNMPRRDNIGVTLDVGHMYLNDGKGYRPYGTIEGLVRSLKETLVHLHLHDYDGAYDHLELGTGIIDFEDLLLGLSDTKYEGFICLELNPDRVSPERIQHSLGWIKQEIKRLS
jgi:sugar phosphate isomerase/epimerase